MMNAFRLISSVIVRLYTKPSIHTRPSNAKFPVSSWRTIDNLGKKIGKKFGEEKMRKK